MPYLIVRQKKIHLTDVKIFASNRAVILMLIPASKLRSDQPPQLKQPCRTTTQDYNHKENKVNNQRENN